MLTLSLPYGQNLAASQGYITPPEEAQTLESTDVLERWVTLKGSGILDTVQECAAWMTKLVASEEWSHEAHVVTFTTFASFAASLLTRLKDEGYIVFAHEPVIQFVKEEDGKQVLIDRRLDYSYKDVIGHLDFEPFEMEFLNE